MQKSLAFILCVLCGLSYLFAGPNPQEAPAKKNATTKGTLANSDVMVLPVLKATESWDGAPIVFPESEAEVRVLFITIEPGGETGWHLHKVPSFAMLLEGELEVQLKDGRVKKVNAGEGLAEVVNTWHNGTNVGDKPAKLVVFYAGSKGQTLTVKESDGTGGR